MIATWTKTLNANTTRAHATSHSKAMGGMQAFTGDDMGPRTGLHSLTDLRVMIDVSVCAGISLGDVETKWKPDTGAPTSVTAAHGPSCRTVHVSFKRRNCPSSSLVSACNQAARRRVGGCAHSKFAPLSRQPYPADACLGAFTPQRSMGSAVVAQPSFVTVTT